MSAEVLALSRYFLRLGAIGFGGPIALVGYMQRDLVDTRRWFSQREFRDGLAFSQLMPGPLAAQLAVYLGWLRGRALGATLAGLAFVTPSLAMVLALSVAYVRWGGLPWMRGAFYGVAAAVVAIIAQSAWKLGRMVFARDPVLWTLGIVNAGAVAALETELIWIVAASGAAALAVRRIASGAAPGTLPLALLPPAALAPLATVFWFFTKAGALVFGSGLAIVPYLYGGVVEQYAWLDDRQFLDAVAVSMITPGPVVITVAFMGYLAAGLTGSLAAAIGVFLPVYLSVLVGAPHFQRLARNVHVRSFVDGVTAAATGAIAGAAFVLGQRAIGDPGAALIAIAALVVLRAARRVPEPLVVLAAGAVGAYASP
jgi:chromate transporter